MEVLLYVVRQVIKFPHAAVIMFVAALAIAGQAVFLPFFTKKILDIVAEMDTSFSVSSVMRHVIYLISILAVVEVILRTYSYIVGVKSIPKLRKTIIEHSMDKLLAKSHSFFQNSRVDILQDKVVALGNKMPDLLELILNKFLSKALIFIFAIFMLWHSHLHFAILMLVWTLIFAIILIYYIPKITSQLELFSSQEEVINVIISDSLLNILSVRLFPNWNLEKRLIETATRSAMSKEMQLNWTYLLVFFWVFSSFIIMQFVSLFWLLKQKQAGTITVGDIGLVLATNYSIVDVLWTLMYEIIDFVKSLRSMHDALKDINAIVEVKNHIEAKDLRLINGTIKVNNITFKYADDCPVVLDNISCEISGGQKVGLVGSSGSGKSTFVKLLLRLYDLKLGNIEIDGQNISMLTQDSLRKNVSIISQEISLFHRSLMENIRYGNAELSDNDVVEAAKKAYAHDFILNMPEKYESIVGERGIKLSGGQRQRIIIARIFLKNAPILILDEATSQLDSVTERLIQISLWELMQGKTTIVVAHRLSTLLEMDRILVFDKGRIVEDGSHRELIAKHGVYKKLWDTQVDGFIRPGVQIR